MRQAVLRDWLVSIVTILFLVGTLGLSHVHRPTVLATAEPLSFVPTSLAAIDVEADALRQADLARQDALRASQKAARALETPRPPSSPTTVPIRPHGPLTGSGGLPAGLSCIRHRESHDDYQSRGRYRGAYQYEIRTWNDYGNYRDPADAPPDVQDRRASEDYARGPRQIHQNWPVTSRACGL